MISNNELVFRIVISAICGGLIGVEREYHNKAGGFRTHILVAVGSALIMTISMYGFKDGDPARLAAQVISGIGFLGAGTIMREKSNVRGLTTAASIWVMAGIGLAFGNGFYLGGAVTTAIVLFSLVTLGFIEYKLNNKKYKTIKIICIERKGLIGEIGCLLAAKDITIKNIKFNTHTLSEENEEVELNLSIKAPILFDKKELQDKLEGISNILDVEVYNI